MEIGFKHLSRSWKQNYVVYFLHRYKLYHDMKRRTPTFTRKSYKD